MTPWATTRLSRSTAPPAQGDRDQLTGPGTRAVVAGRSRGESRRRWSALSRAGLLISNVSEDLGDNSGVEDERENPHLGTASTGQRIYLVDPADHLSPGSSQSATLSSGGQEARRSAGLVLHLTSPPRPCNARVLAVVAHRVQLGLRNVHQQTREEAHCVKGGGTGESTSQGPAPRPRTSSSR